MIDLPLGVGQEFSTVGKTGVRMTLQNNSEQLTRMLGQHDHPLGRVSWLR